jgi:DNA-binding MarR family transcriptional regulator
MPAFMEDLPCLCAALRRSALVATRCYDAALEPSGLRVTMYRLLRRVAAGDGATITALAAELGVERGAMGRNLRVLERDGLLTLGRSDDERARAVCVTPLGEERLAAARPLWEEAQARMRDRLGPRAETLVALLNEIDAEGSAP